MQPSRAYLNRSGMGWGWLRSLEGILPPSRAISRRSSCSVVSGGGSKQVKAFITALTAMSSTVSMAWSVRGSSLNPYTEYVECYVLS